MLKNLIVVIFLISSINCANKNKENACNLYLVKGKKKLEAKRAAENKR